MARASRIQNAFDAGELSSLLLGRQDFDKYDHGMFVCLNGMPLVQGPWTRRPGTAFLHQVKFNSKDTRLFPFQYSTTQTYVLEFGDLYIRFFTDHGILVNTSQSITSITQAATGVVTKNAHGYSNGDRLHLSSMLGMTQLNDREVVVTNKAANTFELYDTDGVAIATTGYGAFTSGSMAKIFEVVTTITESQLSGVRVTQSADTLYITHPSHAPQKLVRVSALSWTLSTLAFTDGPYDVVNTTTAVMTPSAATNAASTAITGAADNGVGLIRITSVAHGLNTSDRVHVQDVAGTTEANGYWIVTRIDADHIDLQGSAFVHAWTSSGTVYKLAILTISNISTINGGVGLQTGDVGRLIRLKEGTIWGYVVIALYSSTIDAYVDILSTLTNTNPKANWRIGVWSDYAGWPACSAFYEDRLYFGGSASYPQRFDGSNVSQYTNFSPSATDGTVSSANSVAGTLNSNDVNAIRWMKPHDKGLLIGTTRSEWQIRGTNQGEAVTPTNITFKPQTTRGSDSVDAIQAARAVLFVQRGSRKLREMAYLLDIDGFKTPDMAQLSEHITAPSITQLAYQEQPQPVVWSVRSDGVLLGMTYDRDAGVVAWHRHELGGSSSADGEDIPVVESAAVVSDPTGTRDELYLVVQRYINGGTKRYVEYMSKIWSSGDAQEDAFYADCGFAAVDSPATDTITGLWHLEGETVGAYVDGARHPDVTVSNGTVTLNTTGAIKILGYFAAGDGQTMPLEGGSQDGSAQGKTKKISRLGLWLLDTLGLKYGPDADTLTELIVRQWGDEYGAATPLFTGVVRERFEGDYDKLGQVYWRADGPFPANVLAVMPQFEVADDS